MEEQGHSPKWPERGHRREVRVSAVAYLGDGSTLPVHVTDISYEGCQIACDQILPIGEKLKLALPRLGEINAQIRWALPGRAGVRFLLEESVAEDRRSRSHS